MGKTRGLLIGSLAVLALSVTGCAAQPQHVDVAPVAHVEHVKEAPAYVPLSDTQIQNFALAYCINVDNRGTDATRALFTDVAKQDAISPAQQAEIIASAQC